MRTSRLTILLAAGFGIALACCTAPEEPITPGTREPSRLESLLLGRWSETSPVGVMRFAGSDLDIEFRTDSLRILDHQFTDAALCVKEADSTQRCSDFRWTNTYEGAWSLIDSSLQFRYRFTGTTASPLTSNRPHPGGSAQFKVSLEGDSLALLQTGGEFITRLPEIRLARASAESP